MRIFLSWGWCWGGDTVVATEIAALPLQQEVPLKKPAKGGASRGRFAGVHSSALWKPALSVISEDRAVSVVERVNERSVRSEKKQSVKQRSTARVRSPLRDNDNRKQSLPMAIPAFSPTPFLS